MVPLLVSHLPNYRLSCEHDNAALTLFLCFQPREEMVLSGKYKSGEQILRLANERFAVPEILFNPSDIGIQEMGVPEAIVYSIQNLPEGTLMIPAAC